MDGRASSLYKNKKKCGAAIEHRALISPPNFCALAVAPEELARAYSIHVGHI